jgi:hypothetical protein
MNFSEYASKLRTHAVAAAKIIPTFDDMAANDDYIHSEEFNVRRQSSRQINDSTKAVINSSTRVDPDDLSSASSSWSLLDRPSLHKSHLAVPSTEEIPPIQNGAIDIANPVSADTSVSTTSQRTPSQRSSIASVPWLAVVTNALEEPLERSGPGEVIGGHSSNTSSDNDEDDSLDSEPSVDDPILFLVRKEKERMVKTRPTRRCSTDQMMPPKHRRFLDDERLSGLETTRMEDELPPAPHAREIQTQDSSSFRGPFGGLVINMAKVQLDKFMGRPDLKQSQTSSTQMSRPPLMTERKNQKPTIMKLSEEEYHQTASSAVLCEDDLVRLSKLRETSLCGTYAIGMMNFLRENQYFGLIFFTLILAFFLFFFKQTADDVS